MTEPRDMVWFRHIKLKAPCRLLLETWNPPWVANAPDVSGAINLWFAGKWKKTWLDEFHETEVSNHRGIRNGYVMVWHTRGQIYQVTLSHMGRSVNRCVSFGWPTSCELVASRHGEATALWKRRKGSRIKELNGFYFILVGQYQNHKQGARPGA